MFNLGVSESRQDCSFLHPNLESAPRGQEIEQGACATGLEDGLYGIVPWPLQASPQNVQEFPNPKVAVLFCSPK